MERLVSPEDYAKAIAAHSRRTSATSLYPGHHYIDLSSWLESRRDQQDARAGDYCLAVLYNFSLKGQERVRLLGVAALGEIMDRSRSSTTRAWLSSGQLDHCNRRPVRY